MNISTLYYETLNKVRELPFKLSDALLVLFLHDLEKPWKNEINFTSKAHKHDFRLNKIKEYQIKLSDEQMNAIIFVEGENELYSNKYRVMNELAAFCHICDVTSARIWFDYPKSKRIG